MLDHTQTENAVIGGVNDGIAKAWPLICELYVAPVCVNTAELLPFQGPAACVVGAVAEAVKGPSLPDASATILEESNV